MADDSRVPLNRTERILAFMVASVAGLSIVAMAAAFLGRGAGADLGSGVWPVVVVLPFPGLLVAFVLVVVFLVVSVVRRRRLEQDGRR